MYNRNKNVYLPITLCPHSRNRYLSRICLGRHSGKWGKRWLYPPTLQLAELHILVPIMYSRLYTKSLGSRIQAGEAVHCYPFAGWKSIYSAVVVICSKKGFSGSLSVSAEFRMSGSGGDLRRRLNQSASS